MCVCEYTKLDYIVCYDEQIELLVRVQYHRNLTSLVGYCKEGTHVGLIYEYMANGNLERHLSGFTESQFDLYHSGNIFR